MTITNIILTNQRRPYKYELQLLQQKLDKIDMSYHLRRGVIIIGGASEILVWQSVKKAFKSSKMWCVSNVIYSINRSETRNINPVDWSSHFPLYILFLSWQGLGLTLFGTLSQMSAITYIYPTWFESTYIGPCLQFFGRNPGWSPMTYIKFSSLRGDPWLWQTC